MMRGMNQRGVLLLVAASLFAFIIAFSYFTAALTQMQPDLRAGNTQVSREELHFQIVDAQNGILAGSFTMGTTTILFEAWIDGRRGFMERLFSGEFWQPYTSSAHFCTSSGDCFAQSSDFAKPRFMKTYGTPPEQLSDEERFKYRFMEGQAAVRAAVLLNETPLIPQSMQLLRMRLVWLMSGWNQPIQVSPPR